MGDTKRTKNDVITVGSCKAYIAEFAGTVPEADALCVPENLLGWIKSGATIKYNQSSSTFQDDFGTKRKTIITEDSAEASLGLITWNGETLGKLASTARVSNNQDKTRRVVKIGGVGNDNGKSYVLCLHHEDKADGDVWYRIVGKNTAGFELAYKPDSETTVNPTFTAEAMDGDGTLIIFEEEIVTAAG